MNRTQGTRTLWPLAVAVLLASSLGVWPATGQSKLEEAVRTLSAERGSVRIDVKIPQVPAEMPLLQLSTIKSSEPFVWDLLRRVAPAAGKFETLRERAPSPGAATPARPLRELRVARVTGTVAAYINPQDGSFEIAPLPQALRPLKAPPEAAARAAAKVLERTEFIPQDDTRWTAGPSAVLYGETLVRTGPKPAPAASGKQVYLAFVPAQRYVQDYPVYGPGSRASVAVGNADTVHGLVRWWKAARIIGRVKPSRNPEEVAAAIRAQLESAAAGAGVTVDAVTVGYYDANAEYMQPVYRFTATVHRTSPTPTEGEHVQALADNHLIGYVPVGEVREAVPSLAAKPDVTPTMPSGPGVPPLRRAPVRPGDPTIGRYVVRNDDSNWVANANEFWSGLTWFWPFASRFTNSQYYWAYPWEYTTSRSSFVNHVNVALTEGHGDWWLFSTLSNCCDLVDINTIPGGYGSSAGGQLRFWAIHSCEVVPAPDDTAHWADPWWNIFKGLHSVVGYRTIMFIDDDIGYPFGFKLSVGVPVVSAWLSTVHGASAYTGNPTYAAHGGIVRPMGRASAIAVCGRENDAVYDTTNIGPPSCLRVFWYPD